MKIKGFEVPQACIDECRQEIIRLGEIQENDLWAITSKYSLQHYYKIARRIIIAEQKNGLLASPSTVTTWRVIKKRIGAMP